MTDARLRISAGRADKLVQLTDYLDAPAAERTRAAANAWIKQLRHLEVDGAPMRRRFTHRGDSLWWFTELYLHKQQVILGILRASAAVAALAQRERPARITVEHADSLTRFVVSRAALRERIAIDGAGTAAFDWTMRLARLTARARWLQAGAIASRLRHRKPAARKPARIVAFVHRAFWRDRAADTAAAGAMTGNETYIGPVLDALTRLAGGAPAFVSLGPSENFSARRWWHPIRGAASPESATAIEHFASLESLAPSRRVWTARRKHRRALWSSRALREAAVIDGLDCWPLVREELAGVALLQWPWSARAMDEAGAAFDLLRPGAALTYAEAGGWGRALVLEARRRSIPIAGLQHGFIYRHWLNYLHEADEMTMDPGQPGDPGFPLPDRTLLFDDYARLHLETAGHFPPGALAVTGSARLDELVTAAREIGPDALATARASAGAAPDAKLVLVVTKYREAAPYLAELAAAAAALPDVHLAIKAHPAETPDVYAPVLQGRPRAAVLPAGAPLAPLILASDAVVTVNSTVALDSAVLGRAALVIGLPNNLSPFVELGAMAGAPPGRVAGALREILYDQELRLQLDAGRKAFLARFNIGSDGRAAERAAAAILDLARRGA